MSDRNSYLTKIIQNIQRSSIRLSRDNSVSKFTNRHIDFVYDEYLGERERMEAEGIAYLEANYRDQCSPYFMWKDSHMRLSWEYLRRSSSYRSYCTRLARFIGWDSEELLKSFGNILPTDIRHDLEDSDIWVRYSAIIKIIKMNRMRTFEPLTAKIEASYNTVTDAERRMREVFKIVDDHMRDPNKHYHPTICRSAPAPQIISVDELKKNNGLVDERQLNRMSFSDIIVVLRTSERLAGQIKELQRMIPGRLVDLPENNDHRRFRLEVHFDYIRILDEILAGHPVNQALAEKIYPASEPASALKRLEKAVIVAKEMASGGYVDLAHLQFKRSYARKFRQQNV